VATDGSLAVWDIAGGDLLFTGCLPDDSAGVTSATAGAGHWWIATAVGRVLGYPLAALLESAANDDPCPLPVGDWAAAADDVAVTALTCLGRTRVGQGPSARDSLVVVTGDATGQVKQWDLLERSNGSGGIALDAWPKMPRQRWPHRAHVLTGHDSPITALVPTAPPSDDSQPLVLAAAQDGSLRAWNGKTGSERVRMEGFTDQLRSLCVIGQDLLLTDGNGPHVTIHDFLHGPEDALKETDLEWDWDE
jgi:WD40 repeat protein